jgi:hypothetical protein
LLPPDCPPFAPPIEDPKVIVGVPAAALLPKRPPEGAAEVVAGCPGGPKLNVGFDISKRGKGFVMKPLS